MSRILRFGFLLMGFSFTVTQGLLIREFLVAFFGNELSIGLILSNWLLLEAVGSAVLSRLADRWQTSGLSFAGLQVLYALFLPVCLYAVYNSRHIVGAVPGEGVGIVAIIVSSFLILIPLAVVDGAMFAFGAKAYASVTSWDASSTGWVYVYEALGALAGGMLFTFLLLPHLDAVQIVWLLCALNLLSAGLIINRSSKRSARARWFGLTIIGLPIVALGIGLLARSGELQRVAVNRQWTGQNLIYSENSVYGNVAVVQQESQYTFYADGVPVLTAPVPDLVSSEEMVHLPLLFVPRPQRALVLSGGLGGVLNELAKYPLDGITYAELDPLLIEAVREFPTPLTESELNSPRVKVQQVDGRLLVHQQLRSGPNSAELRYDLAIVNLPFPTTLQLNRFYTVEFFRAVRGLLTDQGILVVGSPGTLTYMSHELRELNLMVLRTLKEVFPALKPVPGENILWLASPSEVALNAPMQALVERWEQRGIEAQLITPSRIQLKLAQTRLDWFWAALGAGSSEWSGISVSVGDSGAGRINRDLQPVGLFYGLSYWNARFSPQLARLFDALGKIKLWILGIVLVGICLAFLGILILKRSGRRAVVPTVIATTGFTGMAADLVIIFAFQSLYGFVFHWVALLIAAFMAGLSVGGLLMTRKLVRPGKVKSLLLKLELSIVLYWILMPIMLTALYGRIDHWAVYKSVQVLLLLLNAAAGFLVGAQFPVANRLWLRGREQVATTAGMLYASDLVGAFLGGVIVCVVLIPVLGILETCLLLALLKCGSYLLVTAVPSVSV